MGSSEEAFCLKWNDFQASISSSLGGLLHCRDLQDVTLQCGDQSLQCHRLVLAACSDWFRQIFSTLGASAQLAAARHPVIVVWDAAARDMALLLDFMYHGVVNVKQENLNTFLALAERLSVRGLTQNQGQPDNSSGSRDQVRSQEVRPKPGSSGATSRVSPAAGEQEIQEVAVVKQEHGLVNTRDTEFLDPGDTSGQGPGDLMKFEGEVGAYDDSYYEDPAMVEFDNTSGIINSKAGFLKSTGYEECPYCYKSISSTNLKRHIEDVHKPTHNPCNLCGKVFTSSNKLNSHKKYAHKQ